MSRAIAAIVVLLFTQFSHATTESVQTIVTEKTPWDFSFSLGTAFGRVHQAESNVDGAEKAAVNASMEGMLLGVTLNRDLNPDLTFSVGVGGVANLVQGHLQRLGLETGLAYHFLGESFQSEHGRSPYQVSVITKLALSRYNVLSAFRDALIDGSTVENSWGVQGRLALSDQGALQLDVSQSVLALSLGAPQIRAWPTEVKLSYRALF